MYVPSQTTLKIGIKWEFLSHLIWLATIAIHNRVTCEGKADQTTGSVPNLEFMRIDAKSLKFS